MEASTVRLLHYFPLLSTFVSIIFFVYLYRRWNASRDTAMFWWMIGIAAYGLGTLSESVITLMGNTVFMNKFWYIVGALLGGYPLAQGTVYLTLKKKTADRWTWITLTFVAVASILVILSPVNAAALNPEKPSGAILGWTWVRLLTPLINGYAAIFLVGGAFWSAFRFAKIPGQRKKVVATALIAVGAMLPGIGGSMAKAGVVEALYVGEFFGLLLIAAGTVSYGRRGIKGMEQSSEPAEAGGIVEMRMRLDSSKGQFILFVLLTLFLIAQVSWWIIFQAQSGEHHAELQENLWARQIDTAMLWASAHRPDQDEFSDYLNHAFPDLVLDDHGMPRVSLQAQQTLRKETTRAVRMFIYEGTVYATILITGIFFMYWTLRRELSFERRQSSFLSAISHELKTPITALRLYSETLEGPKLTEDLRTEVLGSMRENLDRLSSLIDRLLQARAMLHIGGESKRVTVNLAEETTEATRYLTESLRDLYGVEISSELDSTVRVKIDPEHWRIIVTNLVENAAKYSKGGGTIWVKLEKTHHRAIFSVVDKGVGFRRSEAKRIFQRFYRIGSEDTRTTSGSGLGLYLVSELVQQHRGRIKASSPGEGEGATFTVYLPLV